MYVMSVATSDPVDHDSLIFWTTLFLLQSFTYFKHDHELYDDYRSFLGQ